MQSSEDEATSSRRLSSARRRLGNELHPETALRRGLPPDTSNTQVIPTVETIDNFRNNSAWAEGIMHAFPEGCGGPVRPARTKPHFT